jgi:hypothetical protein
MKKDVTHQEIFQSPFEILYVAFCWMGLKKCQLLLLF